MLSEVLARVEGSRTSSRQLEVKKRKNRRKSKVRNSEVQASRKHPQFTIKQGSSRSPKTVN
ncbi:unnamed protein product, partial [Linum tenue]